jgi:hypothetical protein
MKDADTTAMQLLQAMQKPGSSRGGGRNKSPNKARRVKKRRDGSKKDSNNPVLTTARDNATELCSLHGTDELQIDYRRTLGSKYGDLHVIQGEVFRCSPLAPSLAHVPLILKRLECVDRRTYDLKVYEADTFQRFRGHPNIISLFSYWSEKSTSQYVYKTLVLMYEEGIKGDMAQAVVRNPARVERNWQPDTRTVMRYLCDIAKGLIALHNCKFIHARVKPSALFLAPIKSAGSANGSSNNSSGKKRGARGKAAGGGGGDATSLCSCMLGEMGKVELDSARHTHHFFSKLLIGEAIPQVLVYWAPELLKLEKYGTAIDLWALGVTMYELVTGGHPFPVHDEVGFREAVLSGAVDWTALHNHPQVEEVVRNLIRVDPAARWTAHEVLAFAQAGFAVEVTRVWRGFKERVRLAFERECAVMLQSSFRAHKQQRQFREARAESRRAAATGIQSSTRRWLQWQLYHRQRGALLQCQANVLTRQQHRNYLRIRDSVREGQNVLRTYLATKWYLRVRQKRHVLENRCRDMQVRTC